MLQLPSLGPSLQAVRVLYPIPDRRYSSSLKPQSAKQGRNWLPQKGFRKRILTWRVTKWSSVVPQVHTTLKYRAVLPNSSKAFAQYLRGCSTMRGQCHLVSMLTACISELVWTIFHLSLPSPAYFSSRNCVNRRESASHSSISLKQTVDATSPSSPLPPKKGDVDLNVIRGIKPPENTRQVFQILNE